MATPNYGLPFLGFPANDYGAIMANNPWYQQPQDTSVYDLIARGYHPGDPNAFHNILPNLTTPAAFGTPTAPNNQFIPQDDMSYLQDVINATLARQSAERFQEVGGAAASIGKDLIQNAGVFSQAPSMAMSFADDIPIDAFGAGIDAASEGASLIGDFSDLAGAVSPYVPYAGALLSSGLELAKGTNKGYGAGAGTIAGGALGTFFLPGVGTSIGATLGNLIGGKIGETADPSQEWMNYPTKVGSTINLTQKAGQGLSNAMAGSQNKDDLYNALLRFRGEVGTEIGGYGGAGTLWGPDQLREQYYGMDPNLEAQIGTQPENLPFLLQQSQSPEVQAYLRATEAGDLMSQQDLFGNIGEYASNAIPDLPGATGTEHEGGLSFDSSDMTGDLRQQLIGTTGALTAEQYREPATGFAAAMAKVKSPDDLQSALSSFYSGIGGGYGTDAPQVSTFGAGPDEATASGAIPDLPGLPDQTATQALRQELMSAYSGLINKSNPFTGRQGLPAPAGAAAPAGGSSGAPSNRLSTGGGEGTALNNAVANAERFLSEF